MTSSPCRNLVLFFKDCKLDNLVSITWYVISDLTDYEMQILEDSEMQVDY